MFSDLSDIRQLRSYQVWYRKGIGLSDSNITIRCQTKRKTSSVPLCVQSPIADVVSV